MEGSEEKEQQRAYLLGIGFDGRDGHFRVTRSEDFQILGGSERTHRRMQEKILGLQEKLAREDRTIAGLEPDDFKEVSRFLRED